MTTSITTLENSRGDTEVHITGCNDIKKQDRRLRDRSNEIYTGETLIQAIIDADTDAADAYGQLVYQPDENDTPWTVSAYNWAPCFAKAVKAAKITFQATGRPVQARLVATPEVQADLPTCRKCKTNPVGKVNWTWCRSCVAEHRAAKKNS